MTLDQAVDSLGEAVEGVGRTIETLWRVAHLATAWEERVVCPQCGLRYMARACGPTHAEVVGLIEWARRNAPDS